MIPEFTGDGIKFVEFIKKNKDIFDELLFSGKYYLTRGTNDKFVKEGYSFFIDFEFGDDADEYDLMQLLIRIKEDDKTDDDLMVDEFLKWLQKDICKKYFNKKIKVKLHQEINQKLGIFEEKRSKKRTVKRTSRITEELLDIDYFPDDRKNSIKGKNL